MPVPCMYAYVPLNPVFLGNHSLRFLNLAQQYLAEQCLVKSFLKKKLIGTELEEHSVLPKNGHSGPKIVGFLKKKKASSFLWK